MSGGMNFKTGFVSIVGKPNVGKSTIMNYFVGEKVAIVSEKPETTRNAITGILSEDNYQIIFVDTPGIHRPKMLLGKFMVSVAKSSLLNTDVVVLVVDASGRIDQNDEIIMDILKDVNRKKILLINKIDKVKKSAVLVLIDQLSKMCNFDEIIPVSAVSGEQMDIVLGKMLDFLPEGTGLYPKDQLTDKTERFMVCELIREQILINTYSEVPHSVSVMIEEFRDQVKTKKLYIRAVIYVEKATQKGIIIGKTGDMLKKIGSDSRKEIELFLKKDVYIDLWVKVLKDWRNNESVLIKLGYNGQ